MRARRLVVVGGGVAGLAAARAARLAALRERLPLEVVLLEAEPRLGGKVLTEVADGAVLEWGPDSFLGTKPGARELAAALGLEPELVTAASAPVYLWLGGRLRALPPGLAMGVPTGLRALLGTVRHGIVGPFAALRAAAEPLLPRTPGGSVGEVARRRLGRRAAVRLVEPIVSGIFGAPADELDLSTCLPHLAEARSWVLATAGRPSAPASFLAPRRGMGRIVERLRDELAGEDLRPGCPARAVGRDGRRFRVETDDGEERADAVVLAVPAPAARALLGAGAPAVADALAGISSRPAAVVHLRYRPEAVRRPLPGAGFLAVPEEGGTVAAGTWLPWKWPHLAEAGARLRAIVTDRAALDLPDAELLGRAVEEVGRVLDAPAGPEEVRVRRWADATPVYAPGHAGRVAAARAALPDRLALAGASYEGPGVPDCARSGEAAARALVEALAAWR